MTGPVAEHVGELVHLPREVGARVDRGVPPALGECGQVGVAIADAVLDVGEQVRAVLAAMEDRHVVPGAERGLDDRSGR